MRGFPKTINSWGDVEYVVKNLNKDEYYDALE